MRTIKLYEKDAYLKECNASVLEIKEVKGKTGVILDQTVFYPTGGGQPNDLGTIDGINVLDVLEIDGEIYHFLEGQLKAGQNVHCKIDFERRFDHMQQHSGEHIISGVLCNLYHCDNVGFHLGKDEVVIDYNTNITGEEIAEAEEIANKAIYENIPSHIFILDSDIEYRSKKELFGDIRIVEFGKYDCCACCGTHVKSAGEIGQILVTGYEYIKKGTRIHILCGKRASRYIHAALEDCKKISAMISLPIGKASTGVEKLLRQISKLTDSMVVYKKKYIENIAMELDGTVIFYNNDQLDFNDAKDLVNMLGEKDMVMILFNGQFILTSNQNVYPFLGYLRRKYTVKGGGKEKFAQGKIEADLADIQSSWEEFSHV